ncbi:hypothetical protein ACJJTC_002625 [Scirpophaga incertulas]
MSGETVYERPKRHVPPKMRVHDYLYDSAYIVSGARDYARTAFKAAMSSAQMIIQPVYKSMFSDMRKYPRLHVMYHTNCRLPNHIDRSYSGYLQRVGSIKAEPPKITGKNSIRHITMPKKVLAIPRASPDFHLPSPRSPTARLTKPRNRGTQSVYRESSAQTRPWQPDGIPADSCEKTPEVLFLDQLEYGPGSPYRTGDLPADFHTTEIINKMRHNRAWTELVERPRGSRGIKGRDAIIADLETRDWVFREAEIDELQEIRLHLLHRMQREKRERQTSKTSQKLANLWAVKKQQMEVRLEHIRKSRDRALEDHQRLAEPPKWLKNCGQDLSKSCSGHHLIADRRQLCPRETKWTESFLESLHEDLKKARLGAASGSPCRLRMLQPRVTQAGVRPLTPEVTPTDDEVENTHQAVLQLQKVIRGRAVQTLMYEGRTRAAELTEELKSTHGLQREDKERVAIDAARAREYQVVKSEEEQKEATISSLVDELCGGAVSAALDFLEKELRRLKEERRQHAFILIAMRDKTMREAAEAGRRQKEERRRREHDEMFKQVLGVTQETVEIYLQEVIEEGIELAAEEDAVERIKTRADEVEQNIPENDAMSTAEQNELVAELVHQFLLPDVHKMAARHSVSVGQRARLHAARDTIFGVLDDAEFKKPQCVQCGSALGELCRCTICPGEEQHPTQTTARDDPRWKHSRSRPSVSEKTLSERFPPKYDFRRMIDTVLDEAVLKSRARRSEMASVREDVITQIRQRVEVALDAKYIVQEALDKATKAWAPPPRTGHYHHYMQRVVHDALDRTEPFPTQPCPKDLPSVVRRRAEDEAAVWDTSCKCDVETLELRVEAPDPDKKLLPSELRALEDIKRCKCDAPPPSDSGL